MHDCSFSYIKKFFSNVVNTYESKYLQDLYYVKYDASDTEVVFCIEDSFTIFICVEHQFLYSDQYHIKLEELTPNTIFKFIIKEFESYFDNAYYLIFYKKFAGLDNHMQKSILDSTTLDSIRYVDKKIPKLQLLDRIHYWKGILYNIAFFEISGNNNKTLSVCCSQRYGGYNFAYKKCKDLYEISLKLLYQFKGLNNKNYYYLDGFMFDNNAYITANEILSLPQTNLYNKIRFWIDREYFPNMDIKPNQMCLLDNFATKFKNNSEPILFQQKPVKWKSEYIVYELTQKIFGAENVTFQYRPYFLKHKGHQLSYDIYIPKKKIAIEYQGKQHFEPVEYFGGYKNFVLQQERDIAKKNLSMQNGISLVFINYNDNLTVDLVQQKIKEFIK